MRVVFFINVLKCNIKSKYISSMNSGVTVTGYSTIASCDSELSTTLGKN